MEGALMNRRFRLERKLGEGGMGAVWLARDEVSGEPLALKMLAADRIGGEAALAHFKREFAALAALSHPNLAKVFDFGAIESIEPGPRPPGPAFFFTSEYVEGQDLFRAALPLSYMEICDIAVEVLRALSYIHARGFIHHDVKPSNILVTSGGGVKLLDFGLVGSKSAAPQGIKGTIPRARGRARGANRRARRPPLARRDAL
jgi:serine/threonine-protein kinase